MRTLRTAVVIPATVLALVMGSCGGDDDEATDTTPSTISSIDSPAAVVTTAGPATTMAPTTAPDPADTADIPLPPPPDTADIPLPPPPDTSDIPAVISVTVGVDSSEERIETVALGSVVTVALTNPTASEEYHLHDYDLGDGQEFAPGETATFTFVVDQVGDFELESHVTDDVLLVLRVV